MKNELTRDLLRNILDAAGIATRIDKEGDLYTVLGADEDFPHDVYVYYLIRDGWLGTQAFAKGMKLDMDEAQMFQLANQINSSTKLPKASIRQKVLYFEHWIVIESNFSKEFIKKSLENLTSYTWHAFCNLHQSLK